MQHFDMLGLLASGKRHTAALGDGEFLEDVVLVADIYVLAGRGTVLHDAEAGRAKPEDCQTVGLRVGQRLQQQGVDNAEDGRVGSDADSERQDDHRGQARVFAQGAERVAGV